MYLLMLSIYGPCGIILTTLAVLHSSGPKFRFHIFITVYHLLKKENEKKIVYVMISYENYY